MSISLCWEINAHDLLSRAEAFIKLRQELTRLELEFEQARKLINSLENQLGDKNRELLSAQTDLSAVQKDSIEALNELKNTDKLISTSLTSELERQREETSFITNERDALKSQLIDTLLSNDKLRKESDENKDLNEVGVSSTDADGSDAAKKATEKVEKLRARLIQRNQVIHTPYMRKTCLLLTLYISNLRNQNKKGSNYRPN